MTYRTYRTWLVLQPLLFVISMGLGLWFSVYIGSDLISDRYEYEEVWWATLLRCLNFVVIIHVIPVIIGFLWYQKFNVSSNLNVNITKPNIYVRYVTRGINSNLIQESILNIMSKTDNHPNIKIEVVTDIPVVSLFDEFVSAGDKITEILVPKDYKTANGALYKCRALQYALEVSKAGDEDHILHLDEESQFTDDTVEGLYAFINKNPNKIGQGTIIYNRKLSGFGLIAKFLTLADSIRVADDLSRFRISFMYGYPIFGCKGSFILLKSNIEKQITFDYPPELCITEDAAFAFKAWERGYKFGYVEGLISEVSPSNFTDFIKQRGRWLKGLWHMIFFNKEIEWYKKTGMMIGLITWSCIFLNIVSFVSFFVLHKYDIPLWIVILNGIIFITYIFSYVFGGIIGRCSWWSLLNIAFSPLFLLLETFGVLYGLFTINKLDFHVIKK